MLSKTPWMFLIGIFLSTADTASSESLSWETSCEESICLFRRSMQAENGNAILLEVLINKDDGQSSIVATLPLGVAIEPGIRLSTASADWEMTFKACLSDGCRATRVLDAQSLSTLIATQDLSVSFFTFPNETPVAVPVPTAGLVAAISNQP